MSNVKPNNKISRNDSSGVLRAAYDDESQSIRVDSGFLLYAPGRKIEVEYVDSVTERYHHKEDGTLKYTIEVIYSDSTKENLVSAERVA